VLTERELLDSCELNYDKGYKNALADLEKDGKVVLSREELKEIINQTKETEKNYYKRVVIPQERKETAEQLREEIITLSQELVNSRKETAEKIFEELVGHTFEDDGWTWTVSKEDIQWLAEKYKVEIKE
jgi:hypothetical protein